MLIHRYVESLDEEICRQQEHCRPQHPEDWLKGWPEWPEWLAHVEEVARKKWDLRNPAVHAVWTEWRDTIERRVRDPIFRPEVRQYASPEELPLEDDAA